MGSMLDTFVGEALAWEADELGHLNMRYYFERAEQARVFLMAHLGNLRIAKTNSASRVVPTAQHIHYMKEIRPGGGMRVESGILSVGEMDMQLIHMIYKMPNILSAVIVETISHISSRTRSPFAWSNRVLKRVQKYKVEMPSAAHPRNIDAQEILGTPNMAAADKLNLPIIGQGTYRAQDCDNLGYVRPDALVGRISDCGQHLKTAWPDLDFSSADAMSGAVLEGRVNYRHRPQAGDIFVMRSGLRKASTNTREICHWVLDPVTGKCWHTFIAVACRFNLDTRRLVKVDDDGIALLKSGIVKNLQP